MGFFDDLVAFVLPTAYADNQAQPVEESNKAYGEPHDSDPSEGDAMKQDETVENKSIQSTPKETDAGEDKGDDEEKEGGEEQSSGGDDAEEEEEGGEAEEEEEEEEEPVDVLPKLLEDCEKTTDCRHHKHEYDECVERVHAKQAGTHQGPKEDCIEEFFHLTHCVNQCAAPKLFKALR